MKKTVCREFSLRGELWFANHMYYWEKKLAAGSHFHSYPELHYITRGEVEVTLDFSEKILLKAGDLWIAQPFVHHEEKPRDASGYILELVPQSTRKNSPNALLYEGFVVSGMEELVSLFEKLWNEVGAEKSDQEEYEKAMLTVLILSILRQATKAESIMVSPKNKPKESIMDDFFNHIFDAPEEPCLPQKLAALLHVSERQMGRILSQTYGMSFSEKRTQMRVKYMCYRLVNTNLSIEEISEELGLTTNYAIRIFKKLQGITPLQYRKNHTNQT